MPHARRRPDAQGDRARARARRRTAPWPAVGCVLTRDGEIVGEGATGPFPTGPHAEVAALHAAGDRARGATAYCTLEPCDHHGNTPPCTEALIAESPGSSSRSAIPTSGSRGAVSPACATRASKCRPEVSGRRRTRSRAVPASPPNRARVRRRQGCAQPRRARRRRRRHLAVDHVRSGPRARAARRLAGDRRRRRYRARGSTVADGANVAPRPARPAVRVLLDGRGRVPADGPLFDPELGPTLVVTTEDASAGAVDAWRNAGGQGRGGPAGGARSRRRPRRRVHGARTRGRAAGAGRRRGKADRLDRRGATRSGSSRTSRRCCSGPAACPASRSPGAPPSATPSGSTSSTSCAPAPTLGIERARAPRGEPLMFTGIVEELGRGKPSS